MDKERWRTDYVPVKIVGGPYDGMHMRIRLRPNGRVELDQGGIFFPDGVDDYEWDRDAGTLTLRAD